MNINPFLNTKASSYEDSDILKYWVSPSEDEKDFYHNVMVPQSTIPIRILGGKGSGKTHILRYYSFPLQKIRYDNDVESVLINDKYIGLYSVFHGLNSSRFNGKGVSESEWQSVFEYYFELYLCDNLLLTIKEIINSLKIKSSTEVELVNKILILFNNYSEINGIDTIDLLISFLSDLRRKIDFQVLNAAFTRKLDFEDVKVLFTPGDLLFGIPNHISNSIDQLGSVKFIYIFDEYEKLYEWQKKFVNTLVWDKKNPVTFWIGARRYGYTTRETKSGQEMKSGSEYQDINLDVFIRQSEDLYKKFAEKLFINRLIKYYESKRLKIDPNLIKVNFYKKFEQYSELKIINQIIDKNRNKEFKHIRELRRKLSLGIKSGLSLNLSDDSEIDNVIENLIENTDNNPLAQKYKAFLFYKLWYKAKQVDTFKVIIEHINTEYDKHKKGEGSEFNEIVDKRKKDFIAQLTKENNIKNTEYSGINEFIRISQGNARSFILILKKVIEFSRIRGERPLEEGATISIDSQYLAVYDTARWFYEDVELVGEIGKKTYASLKRLSDYFILERFCDKPVETTVSCFYIKSENISAPVLESIETMKIHSILIEDDDGRLEKNTGRKERLFQINKVLAPLWSLPTFVRGNHSFNVDLTESIFNSESDKLFDQIYQQRKSQLNAPEFRKKLKDGEKTLSLFNK